MITVSLEYVIRDLELSDLFSLAVPVISKIRLALFLCIYCIREFSDLLFITVYSLCQSGNLLLSVEKVCLLVSESSACDRT